jgi:hypothetical protein
MQRVYDPIKQSADAAKAAAGAAERQAGILQSQLDTMQVEQRAWVSFSNPEISTDLTVDLNSGAKTTFRAIIQNSGHLPAENVRPEFTILSGPLKEAPNQTRKRVCAEAAKAPLVRKMAGILEFYGDVLFPGDKKPVEHPIVISPETINDLRFRHVDGAIIWIIVCINYKIIQRENDQHQTSHIFMVHGTAAINIPLGNDGVVPKDQLGVAWHEFGTIAN